jgi:hypothetical protein
MAAVEGLKEELAFHKGVYNKYVLNILTQNVEIAAIIKKLCQKREDLKVIFESLRKLRGEFTNLEWKEDKVADFLGRIEKSLDETLSHSFFTAIKM